MWSRSPIATHAGHRSRLHLRIRQLGIASRPSPWRLRMAQFRGRVSAQRGKRDAWTLRNPVQYVSNRVRDDVIPPSNDRKLRLPSTGLRSVRVIRRNRRYAVCKGARRRPHSARDELGRLRKGTLALEGCYTPTTVVVRTRRSRIATVMSVRSGNAISSRAPAFRISGSACPRGVL